MAPPSTRASAHDRQLVAGLAQHPDEGAEIADSDGEEPALPPAPARKLNAAPALWTSTRLKKGVTSSVSP